MLAVGIGQFKAILKNRYKVFSQSHIEKEPVSTGYDRKKI